MLFAGELPLAFLVIIGVIAVLLIGWSSWLFPYMSQFENTTKIVLGNCLYMFLRHF